MKQKQFLSVRETVIFAMLGSIMFCSKLVMEFLPNVHLLGMLTITYTVVYRAKALIPIYIYVLLNGLYAGFSPWWVPYLYIWTILWGLTMLLPRRMPQRVACAVYPLLCGLHGFAFGILYSPAQALMFRFTRKQMAAWIIAGLPWDVVHGIGNVAVGLLIIPMIGILRRLNGGRFVSNERNR